MLFETQQEPTLATVTLSRRVESMPKLAIEPDGPLGEAFLAKGCIDFHDAVRHVRDLPWGRPEGEGPKAVIDEGKGTATDKHVLLASLARELGDEELQLVLGIYRVSADSTPAAAVVLGKANLDSLPEAMVWLRWYGGDYDFSSMRAGSRALVLLQEELVTLDQLPDYQLARHKDFLLRFGLSSRRKDLRNVKTLWGLREELLGALIAEQESFRRDELQLAQDIATAEEQARERALTDAEQAAQDAQDEIRRRAAAEAAKREEYEKQEAEREAAAVERAKARAARGDDEEATGRRRTRRAPGRRGAPEPPVEEVEEEESVRKSTRRAPTSKLAEEAGEVATGRKRTRKRPGAAAEEEEAAPAPQRKRTRKRPGAAAAEPEEEDVDEEALEKQLQELDVRLSAVHARLSDAGLVPLPDLSLVDNDGSGVDVGGAAVKDEDGQQ